MSERHPGHQPQRPQRLRQQCARWLQRSAVPALALPRPFKRALALAVDASLCVLTVWLAFYLRLDEWVRLSGDGMWQPYWAVLAALLLALPIFATHGFYRMIFRYAGAAALLTGLRAFALYALLFATLVTAVGLPGVPRSVGLIQPMLLLLAVGATRLLVRAWLGGTYQALVAHLYRPKAFIYGAGECGRQLAAALAHSPELQVLGFVDDDERLHGQELNGLRIRSPHELPALVGELGLSTLLLALPNLERAQRNALLERLRPLPLALRTLPSVADLAHGKVTLADLHELDIDDLLGREPVQPNLRLLSLNVTDKLVLVTGAGGSIGSELCRQIVRLRPRALLLLEHSEYALYAIEQELRRLVAAANAPASAAAFPIVALLGNVQDGARLREILHTWRPHTLYHAAAYKHVPLVEHNLAEGLRNNVWGTWRCAEAARAAGVADFVLVSTDKAVRPTNVMGASKRLAEMLLQALAQQALTPGPSPQGRGERALTPSPGTRFCMVRFGNVLGSSGSVVPLFRQQIRAGGPITLTHPDVTRYFMSIPEAAQLVIQAGAMARGGEVFVLDMGPPVRIVDLARRMVELSGLRVRDQHCPDGDIAIALTGLRPGEKLHEELLTGDHPQPTAHPRICSAQEPCLPWAQLQPRLLALEQALNKHDAQQALLLLQELVPGYRPRSSASGPATLNPTEP